MEAESFGLLFAFIVISSVGAGLWVLASHDWL